MGCRFNGVVIGDYPTLFNLNITNNQKNVAITNSIYFEIADNIQVMLDTITVWLGTNFVITNGVFISNYSGSITGNSVNGYAVLINPDFDFQYDQTYTLEIRCRDIEHAPWLGVTNFISFTTEPVPDTKPPVTTANPPGGTYSTALTVELSVSETACIYYTVNGTKPTTNSSQFKNSGTIPIEYDTVLKFFAVDTAGNTEKIKTETYKILDITEDCAIRPNVIDLTKCEKGEILINKQGYAEIRVYNTMGDLVLEYPGKDYNIGDSEFFPVSCDSDLGAGLYIIYIKGDNIDIQLKTILLK